MQKEYMLKGLDCANCAAKIETAVKNISGVRAASCSAIHSSLMVEVEGNLENPLKQIVKIVHKYEPRVKVIEKSRQVLKSNSIKATENLGQYLQIVAGTVVFVAALLISYSFELPYVSLCLYLLSYLILGWRVLLDALSKPFRKQFFDENFLMAVATIGALIISEYPEAVAVMLFYRVGEFFQSLAVRRSRKSISELMDIRPDYANVEINGKLTQVDPESIKIGEIIIIKPGEKIPLDGIIIEGISMLDTKALTGESVPKKAQTNDSVVSGCINLSGVLAVKVTKAYSESTVAQIINLVENASNKKTHTENFITSFSKIYTPIVVLSAVVLAVVPALLIGGWAEWVHRALVFLVISCPCALVISVPLSYFGGIGGASRNGILVKGSNYLDALNKLELVVFDKTGTLTEGVFEITSINPSDSFSENELLEYAAFAEYFSNHPIATSVLKKYGSSISKDKLSDFKEIPGFGVSVLAAGKQILAGNDKLMVKENIKFTENTSFGTKVYIAVSGIYAGCIIISDKIKQNSKEVIAQLKKLGIKKTFMLTGDNFDIAMHTAREIGVDGVYAELLPQDKVGILEKLETQKTSGKKLAFVGDGINDAPVLARADIGIAMGALGSDAAIEAADVVLMTDELSKIATAVKISKKTKRIVWQNIFFALGIKAVFLTLGALGLSGMWEAVFADTGVSVLAILNALRAIKN